MHHLTNFVLKLEKIQQRQLVESFWQLAVELKLMEWTRPIDSRLKLFSTSEVFWIIWDFSRNKSKHFARKIENKPPKQLVGNSWHRVVESAIDGPNGTSLHSEKHFLITSEVFWNIQDFSKKGEVFRPTIWEENIHIACQKLPSGGFLKKHRMNPMQPLGIEIRNFWRATPFKTSWIFQTQVKILRQKRCFGRCCLIASKHFLRGTFWLFAKFVPSHVLGIRNSSLTEEEWTRRVDRLEVRKVSNENQRKVTATLQKLALFHQESAEQKYCSQPNLI